MKWIIGFVLFILVALTCCESRAATGEQVVSSVATTETITLGKGMTLWKTFVAQKLPRRDWPKYWKDTCALSKTACTDSAWRKLPVGTVITVPRDPSVVLAQRQAQINALQTEIAALKQSMVELSQSLNDVKSELKNVHEQLILAMIATIVIVILGLVGIMVRFNYRHAKRDKTINCNTCEVTEESHGLFATQDAYPPPTHTPPLKAAYPGSS